MRGRTIGLIIVALLVIVILLLVLLLLRSGPSEREVTKEETTEVQKEQKKDEKKDEKEAEGNEPLTRGPLTMKQLSPMGSSAVAEVSARMAISWASAVSIRASTSRASGITAVGIERLR